MVEALVGMAAAVSHENVQNWGLDCPSTVWRGVHQQFQSWSKSLPDWRSREAVATQIDALRAALHETIRGSRTHREFLAGADGILAARAIGDAETVDLLVGMVADWTTERVRFPSTRTLRNDVAALSLIVQTVDLKGSARQRERQWLAVADRVRGGLGDLHELKFLRDVGLQAARDATLPELARAKVQEAIRLQFGDEESGRVSK